MAEGARTESVYTATYRGSNPPHRHIRDESLYESTGSFLYILHRGMRTPTGVRQLAQPVGRTAHAVSGLPRGRAKRVNPPHRHILRRARTQVRAFLYILHRGMRTPDRGSTTGAASWTNRARSKRAARRRRAKRVNPPHRHIRDESLYASTGFFFIFSAGDENPRPGFDNWRSQLDEPRTQ